MMRHTPRRTAALRVACLTAALVCAAPVARGAAVFVSRRSDLRASGATAAGEYQLSNASDDADDFADWLSSDEAAAAHSAADQRSAPRLKADGGLAGADAEGSVMAAVDAGAADAFADAESTFDLVFRVEDAVTLLTFDGALSAAGDGTAAVRVYDVETGDSPLSEEVSDAERPLSGRTLLAPGTYGLSAYAFARGSGSPGTAFFTVQFALQDAPAPGPVPMPLPAGAVAGLFGLAAVAGLKIRARRRPER